MQQTVPKRVIKKEEINNYSLLYQGKNGEVRKLSRDEVLKIISDQIIEISLRVSPFSKSLVERNILYSHRYEYPEAFYLPTAAVYTEKGFVGYTQEFFRGMDILDYYRLLLKEKGTYTFDGLLEPYKKLNQALKSTPHTVCPDLASGGNILVNDYDDIAITDFVGLQIGGSPSTDISNFLITSHSHIQEQVQENFEDSKYTKADLYTKELDKRTILLMMIRDILNFDMTSLELKSKVFPFELKRKKLLELRLKTKIIATQLSGKYDKEGLDEAIKKERAELAAIKRQRNKTDYDLFKQVLSTAGIKDNSHFQEAILKMSDIESENVWLENVIDELESGYILENMGRVRRLIKK